MAYFILRSKITIGKFTFSGVNNVQIKRGIRNYTDTAVIKVPSVCRVQKGRIQPDGSIKILPGTAESGLTRNKFEVGDEVVINLGYDEDMREEFRGFVKRRGVGTPMSIECEGYIRQLRLNVTLNGYLKNTNAEQLLEMAAGIRDIKGKKLAKPLTDVTVMCQDDIPMHNIQLISANGQQIIDEIKKVSQGTLVAFFIQPKVLWCGLAYTTYVDNKDTFAGASCEKNATLNYQTGYNCVQNSDLTERVVTEPLQVILNTTMATGQVVQTKSEANYAKRKQKLVFNNIQDTHWMKKMANEKQYRANYKGMQGSIPGFLQPYCAPGYQANLFDSRYPELKGAYMVVGVDVTFGVGGGRRRVEIGPLIGFNPNKATNE